MDKSLALLNNLSPSQFLAEYWQKKPLLIRQAIPHFKSFLSPDDLVNLAIDDDAEARLITNNKGKWKVKSNPLDERDFGKLPKTTSGHLTWTLLVQNVNHYLPQAADLLAQFNFIPHARLDDLMISYAPKGSGIGAHVDSYDVFLLQGAGKRKWQISETSLKNPEDLSLVEGAPIKILQNFKPEQEWILEAGDMLYLPPHIAHCGTSESDDCMTYSIGFRAPSYAELAHEFLHYLQDNLPENPKLKGQYADPDLSVPKHAGEISDALQANIHAALQGITWKSEDIADFLGHYLTEPKAHVYFDAPAYISLAAFTKKLATKTLYLSLKSHLLFTKNHFYLNGEKLAVAAEIIEIMKQFADNKLIDTSALQANTHAACSDALYVAYLAGFVCFKR